jgi:antitoxin CcdA
MRVAYDESAPRRATNLRLNGDLVEKARAADLNLSAIAEQAIAQELRRILRERFREEIAQGVAEHEAYLREHGSFAEAVWASKEDLEGHDGKD